MEDATGALCALVILAAHVAWAGEAKYELGVRAGANIDNKREDFTQAEVHGGYRLPWSWEPVTEWTLSTWAIAHAGTLHAAERTGFTGGLGPGFVFGRNGSRLSFDAGSCFTFLTEEQFGGDDLGGPLQFTIHLGARVGVFRELGVSYRFHHISNAGLFRPNPGVNMHQLGLNYRY